jgi:acyl-CoA thioesterase-1
MMRKRAGRIVSVVIAICIGFLWACSQPKLTPVPIGGIILAFGDSLTYGTGAREGSTYPEVLERLVKRKVVRSGVPGETSAEGLARLPEVLDTVDPNLVILCHGGNDLLRKMDSEKTKENIAAMISMIRGHGSQVVLIGVPRPGLLLSTAEFYRDIAEDLDVPYEDTVIGKVLSQGNLKSDYIHPNDRGYARIAEVLAQFLKKHKGIVN